MENLKHPLVLVDRLRCRPRPDLCGMELPRSQCLPRSGEGLCWLDAYLLTYGTLPPDPKTPPPPQ